VQFKTSAMTILDVLATQQKIPEHKNFSNLPFLGFRTVVEQLLL
jgi:hypothetical protein